MIRKCSSTAATNFTAAVDPWVRSQRWCPQTTQPLHPRDLLHLGQNVYILLAQVHQSDLTLQIPLITKTNPDPELKPIGTCDGSTFLYDGTASSEFWIKWAEIAKVLSGTRKDLIEAANTVVPLGVEQSNTSVLLGSGEQKQIAKVFRVLHPGPHPEVELPHCLSAHGYPGVPATIATWDLPHLPNEEAMCSAVVSTAIKDATDGFDHFTALASAATDPFAESAQIGSLIGELHNNLQELFGTAPPPSTAELRTRMFATLNGAQQFMSEADISAASSFIDSWAKSFPQLQVHSIRIHGDLHLGQLLKGANGNWYAVDFEGEPLKDLESRRKKDLPLRDVAGMLRSFDYAASHSTNTNGNWDVRARDGFLTGYQKQRQTTDEELGILEILELEKALYEVQYEGQFRPKNLPIPLQAARRITNQAISSQ